MGWEPILQVWYLEARLPDHRLLIDLLPKLRKSNLFGELFYTSIIDNPSLCSKIHTIESIEEGISDQSLEEFLSRNYYKPLRFSIECGWRTYSYYKYVEENHYGRSIWQIVEYPWRLFLTIFDREVGWPTEPYGVDMRIDLGKSTYLEANEGDEAGKLNILSLMYQLVVIIESGVGKIYGPNKDNEMHPETFYLVYHSNPDGFREDLTLWTQNLSLRPNLTRDDIVGILKSCTDIDYLEVNGGWLVFHKYLVNGNLKRFYDLIIEKLIIS
jgi:hypothetical protein